MKRICLFAGYDSKNIIHDYVVYYLKELSTIADVYYMADNEISDEEKRKILPYVKEATGYKHNSYDLGSWSILINILGWDKISEYDELILANDSVCGPVYPMQEFINNIKNDKEWDICGIDRAYNNELNTYFLSNYFLIFRNKTFLTEIFKKHLNNTIKNSSRKEIINTYEVSFMRKFYENGYTVKSVLSQDVKIYDEWIDAVKFGSPFIKIKGLLGNTTKIQDIIYIYKKYNYPLKLIKKLILKRIVKNIRQNFIKFHIGKGNTYIKIFGINIIKQQKIYNKPIDETSCPIKKIKI